MTADNTKEWADKILASLKCPNKDCGVECGIDDYECSRCNTHLLPLASIRTRKYIDQLRREAIEEYLRLHGVPEFSEKEYLKTKEYVAKKIQEAKKELLDEIEKDFAIKPFDTFSHIHIDDIDFEKLRAKTLGDIRSIAPLDSQPEGFESNVKK